MKTITSNVDELPGSVEFPDYLTLPQVVEYSRVANLAKGKPLYEQQMILLPAQLAIVKKWNIQGVPEKPEVDTFPFSPSIPASKLLTLIHREIIGMIVGEQKIPNT